MEPPFHALARPTHGGPHPARRSLDAYSRASGWGLQRAAEEPDRGPLPIHLEIARSRSVMP